MSDTQIDQVRGAVRPKIRIAFVIDTLFMPAGGTESQLLRLIEHLDRDRFAPYVFCLRGTEWLEREFDLCPSTVLDVRVGRDPRLLLRLLDFAAQLRRGEFDIVQTHFRDANLAGVAAAWWAKVPVIISTRRGVPYFKGPVDLWILRWFNARVTHFIANSEATRARYARDEGFDPSRVEVIYNGLEPSRFVGMSPSDRDDLRKSIGVPPEVPLVGIVANLRSVKGVLDFVDAAAAVAERVPTAHFVVIGQGDQEAKIRERVTELRLDDRLQLLGARDDVPSLLQTFDCGVLASHFESFSNSILEYLAAGLPVVVTDVGGVREAVTSESHGFVVPPQRPAEMAAALIRLLEHPGGARAWRSGPTLPEHFELSRMVDAHGDLYQRLYDRHCLAAPKDARALSS